MMKGLILDETMSNLTSASGEASPSSVTRTETGSIYPAQKKKRGLPGNPDPDAEVIAMSPKSLLATNRFVCEICNKGFQRDQNLQLHRRGHNLPWKLKQRTNKEVKKKVYVCPEATCVHHDPSRALGDLTGIKKHYSRKHGEKKWKCDKCLKRYAVQSDWKAHSKICGTREYKCDCGTLFSRRDSFITHRAFCDALAEESARATTAQNPLISLQHGSTSSSQIPLINFNNGFQLALPLKREEISESGFDNNHLRPDHQEPPPNLDYFPKPPFFCMNNSEQASLVPHEQNTSSSPNISSNYFVPSPAAAHMSATALLQKAAQIGVTMTKPSPSPAAMQLRPHQAGSVLGLSSHEEEMRNHGFAHGGIINTPTCSAAPSGLLVQDHVMSSSFSPAICSGFGGQSFEEAFGVMFNPGNKEITAGSFHGGSDSHHYRRREEGGSSGDGLTRDFLGLRAFPDRDLLSMSEMEHVSSSSSTYQHRHNQNQTPWQG